MRRSPLYRAKTPAPIAEGWYFGRVRKSPYRDIVPFEVFHTTGVGLLCRNVWQNYSLKDVDWFGPIREVREKA